MSSCGGLVLPPTLRETIDSGSSALAWIAPDPSLRSGVRATTWWAPVPSLRSGCGRPGVAVHALSCYLSGWNRRALLERFPSMSQPLAPRILRPRRAAPDEALRPTRAEVNLAALRHNLHVVRKHAAGAQVWAVIKADAYGHGAPAVARTLERAHVDGFCVALIEEGVELREAGIAAPILLMGGHYGNAYDEVIAQGLTPVVHDLGQVEAFARMARSREVTRPIRVHLKVDTGMARLGVTMEELPALAAGLAACPEVHIYGLMTHLACADAPTREPTDEQLTGLHNAIAILGRHGVYPEQKHAANSAALLRGLARLDAVRPGIALFGVAPRVGGAPLTTELKPVMRVRTEIVAMRDVGEGHSVGYGATWRAPCRSRIATLPLGYADGLSRRLGNRGHVLVRGKRAPIVGSVSMDMTMVDVTSVDGACVRDEVVVLGVQEGVLGRDAICVDEIATQADTIAWEVLTSVSRRVPRFYRDP